ncbi:creatininase [Oricola nitratireducens]|uniref:creatininase n=1 Tax=Oricola nitratireducens TaxID=2775868 RepID=UPI001865AF7D|nr:creatininase [Oricola nitratireducens]
MTSSVMMSEMTWPEYAAALESNPVVFLPTGALEQHGPHLPMSVDYLLPSAIAREVATEVGGVVAAPVTYGYKSMTRSAGGPFFPGSTGLDGATLSAVVRDVIRELVRHGARRICVLDGNYENLWFLNEGIDLAMREIADKGVRVMCLQHWEFLTEETLAAVFPDGYPGIELEHAAVLETSLMMNFHPELVRFDKVPDNEAADAPCYDVWPPRREWVAPEGSLISARGASPEKGAIIAAQYRRDITAAVKREFYELG